MMTGGFPAEQTCSQRFAASVRGVVTSKISTSILPRLNNLCISAPSFTTMTLKSFRHRMSETGSRAARVWRTSKMCAEKSMIGGRAPSSPLARADERCTSVGGEAHSRLGSVPQVDHWTVALSGQRRDRPPCGTACNRTKKYPGGRATPRREEEESGLRRHIEAGKERRTRRGRRESD
jgi:hypothetical protein